MGPGLGTARGAGTAGNGSVAEADPGSKEANATRNGKSQKMCARGGFMRRILDVSTEEASAFCAHD